MSPRFFFLLLLPACAGPSAHQSVTAGSALATTEQEAVRPAVATTLASDNPLAVSNCALPTAPSSACAEPADGVEQKPDPHQHHHHESAVSAPEPETEVADAKVTDPMCKMKIDPKTAGGGSLTFEGKQHFFCSSSCRRNFLTQHPGAK
jgi:YHS domain-containing protein